MKGDCVAFHTLGAKHDAQRKMHRFENRPLLDVKFQIGGSVRAFDGRLTDPFDLNATSSQSFFQVNTVAVNTVAVGFDGMCSAECRGAEKAPAEASTLFICPVHDANRDGRLASVILSEAAQYFKGGENTEAAVQPATVRYGVKMTSKDKSAVRIALKSRPGVAGSIIMVLDGKSVQLVLKPCARLEPGRAPCNALSAIIVRGQRAESLKIRDYPKRICWHTSSPEDDRLLLFATNIGNEKIGRPMREQYLRYEQVSAHA
jgi:hypothetical protein